MGNVQMSKVTISLPKSLVEFADKLAREKSTTRSGVFTALLAREEEAEVAMSMAEGYQEMADENRLLAEEAFPIVAEMLARDTRWDQ